MLSAEIEQDMFPDIHMASSLAHGLIVMLVEINDLPASVLFYSGRSWRTSQFDFDFALPNFSTLLVRVCSNRFFCHVRENWIFMRSQA